MIVILRRLAAVLAVVLIAIITASSAFAQPQSTGDKVYAECRSRAYDSAAYSQLRKDGVIEDDSFLTTEKEIQEAKKQHPEEFARLAEHYEQDQGTGSKLGRTLDSFGCQLEKPFDIVGDKVSKFWKDPFGKFVQAMLEGNAQALETVLTLWTDYRIDKAALNANVQGVKNIVYAVSGFALIASIIVGGGRIAASRRMGLADGVEDLGRTIGAYLIYSLLVVPAIAGGVIASDALGDWIMASFGTNPQDTFAIAQFDGVDLGPVFTFCMVLVALAGSVVQIVALAVRALLLPLAAGLTPLMAALSFTQTGKAGLQHITAWMIAAVIFKPVSALLYCVMFWWATNADDSLISTLVTTVMVGAAGLIAPALVRSIVPALAQAGGGGAAPVMAGGAAVLGTAGGFAAGVAGVMGSAGKAAAGAAGRSGASGSSGLAGASISAGAPRGGGGVSGGGSPSQAAQPQGAAPSGGGSGGGTGGISQAAQPQGAAVGGGRVSQAAGVAKRVGSRVAQSGGGVANGAAVGLRATGVVATTAARGVQHVQGILDDSLGAGGYHGQIPR